ncbi:urea carboxylase-associated family protein [Mesorhizobium sp. BH1-1-4]|uniref:urea carboxylase-associated family protein n=1 Tax=Mesorhizobium sp. BH1-1-4 TaxID=2876662 RepID=UPI001CD0E7D5|nr:DUF1989 domain-containing protein [Mesorhizobium sp. BH1-1-4]MBZ9994000.1 DUF1989 domain-containing protein [Mesorhizobium sp. BH1-1-4]
MKRSPFTLEPPDAAARKAVKPVICYPTDTLPRPDLETYRALRDSLELVETLVIPPRDAATWEVPAGHFCRLVCSEGSQVGDLNLFHLHNLSERFYSGKTRALNGTHVGSGDQLFSNFPYLRPIATITHDTLDWYGFDEFGGSVHDVIGTRCDPYTHNLLSHGAQYHYCCHSNLTRALAKKTGLSLHEAEQHVHDVLNVFMCTGFTRDTGQYFMKASPVRPGDYLEFFAEIDLLGCMSACPGGDCSSEHSSDAATCHPLVVEVYKAAKPPHGWKAPPTNGFDRTHGV